MGTAATQRQLGARLRGARKSNRLSLDQVALQVGVTRQALWAWEQGKSQVTALRLAELAEIYGISADFFLFGVQSMAATMETIMLRAAGSGPRHGLPRP